MILMSKIQFTFQHYQYGSEPGQTYNSEPYIYIYQIRILPIPTNKRDSVSNHNTSYFQFDTHFSAVSIKTLQYR